MGDASGCEKQREEHGECRGILHRGNLEFHVLLPLLGSILWEWAL